MSNYSSFSSGKTGTTVGAVGKAAGGQGRRVSCKSTTKGVWNNYVSGTVANIGRESGNADKIGSSVAEAKTGESEFGIPTEVIPPPPPPNAGD